MNYKELEEQVYRLLLSMQNKLKLSMEKPDKSNESAKSMVSSDGRQRVKPDCFEKHLINYATKDLREEFEGISKQIFQSIQLMVDQNRLLKEARDILLPRLMTGMVDPDEWVGAGVDDAKDIIADTYGK